MFKKDLRADVLVGSFFVRIVEAGDRGGKIDLDWGATKLSGEENCDFGLDGGVSGQMKKNK